MADLLRSWIMTNYAYISTLLTCVSLLGCSGESGDNPGADAAVGADGQVGTADAATDATPIPSPDAMPSGITCQTKDPVLQLGFNCNYVWSQCSNGAEYTLDCRTENVGGNIFSLCDCIVDGNRTMQTISENVCSQGEWPAIETIVNDKCEWQLM